MTIEGEIPDVTTPGWTSAEDHGSGVSSLHYPDGKIRIRHTCNRTHITIINAPALQLTNGHTVVQREPLTVNPSILCDDCGLHGFITNGSWFSA